MPKLEEISVDRKRTFQSLEGVLSGIISGFVVMTLIGIGAKNYEIRENALIREVVEICDSDGDGKVSREEYFGHYLELTGRYPEKNPFLIDLARKYNWISNKMNHINNLYLKCELNI